MKIKKAVIPAAGFGTRLLPVTKALPKIMLPIVDKPAVHYLVEEAVESGVQEIIIIYGQEKNMMKAYFNNSPEIEEHLAQTGKLELLKSIQKIADAADISYISQRTPRGLGHAIYCTRNYIEKNEAFAVLLGDDIIRSEAEPCLAQMIKIFSTYQANIIGVQNVPDQEVNRYGIVKGSKISDGLLKVDDLIEKPDINSAPSNLAIMGRYIIHSDIFTILENTSPGAGGEIQLTDALKELTKKQELYAYVFKGIRYDIGDKLGFLKAAIEYAVHHEEIKEEVKDYLINGLPVEVRL